MMSNQRRPRRCGTFIRMTIDGRTDSGQIMKRLLCVILLLAMAGAAPRYGDHEYLMYWLDEKGERHEVRTTQDWLKRREDVLKAVQLVMGEMPKREKAPLEMKVEEETPLGELRRLKISFASDAKTRGGADPV